MWSVVYFYGFIITCLGGVIQILLNMIEDNERWCNVERKKQKRKSAKKKV